MPFASLSFLAFLLPDPYGQTVAGLRREGFTILDARELLRASGLPPGALFTRNGKHFEPVANRLMAARLRQMMDSLPPPAPATAQGRTR